MNRGMDSVKKSLAELKAKIQGDEGSGRGSRTPAEIAANIKANIELAKANQLTSDRNKAKVL